MKYNTEALIVMIVPFFRKSIVLRLLLQLSLPEMHEIYLTGVQSALELEQSRKDKSFSPLSPESCNACHGDTRCRLEKNCNHRMSTPQKYVVKQVVSAVGRLSR